MNRSAIRTFVRDTLGCTCDEVVFQDIQIGHPPAPLDGVEWRIGGRLLIWLVAAGTLASLPELLRAGRERRDSAGFNRFRLVLAPAHGVDAAALRQVCQDWAGGDPRLHLHLMEPGALAELGNRTG